MLNMKVRYLFLLAIIGFGSIWLFGWFDTFGFGLTGATEDQILSFAVVFLCVFLALIYLKFGDKKIKCLKCSNLMWKDAHRCASCHWDYKHSYNESYESLDAYFKRRCRLGLAFNKIKTHVICALILPLVLLVLSLLSDLFSNGWDLKEFWFRELKYIFNIYLVATYYFFGLLFFTGIFDGERKNSWCEINEKGGD